MRWLLAFHIVAFVAWFGGIFYLPRLLVYHAMATDRIGLERFVIMERKLYRAIMTPAAVATIVIGFVLLAWGWDAYRHAGWVYAKLVLVGVLVGYHVYCGVLMRTFAREENVHSHRFYRWFNELPLLLLIPIVLLAVVKPF